ncbi:MAG: hypothetical protein FWJ70_08570 [Micromonosporaceae bacterium]
MRWRRPTFRRPNWSWRKTAVAVIGLLVVVWLGRGLLPSIGTIGGSGEGEEAPKPKPPEQVIDLDGKKVPAVGGPVAVLNPGLARPGATVGVAGSGFDAGARVRVLLSTDGGKPKEVASGKVDRNGSVTAEFTFPQSAAAGNEHLVTVHQVNSDKVAEAQLVSQAGVATVKLSDETASPGDTLTVDAEGFLPGEKVNVYWGRAAGKPAATLEADEHGSISKESVRVGVAPAGQSTLVLVGAKSQSAAVAPFTMLSLYPSAVSQPYAARAGQTITVSGKGFAPGERVLVHLNQATGVPAFVDEADGRGNLAGVTFKLPFGLKGKQNLILTGEQSRASVSTGFTVMPYQPSARANTYGGLPGTTLTFYVKGFAPNEAVHVYANRSKSSQGELVSAFRVDGKGTASAAGKYVIPGDAQGKLTLTLVGAKSEGTATTTVTVDKPDGPVNVPPQPKYKLPKELEE